MDQGSSEWKAWRKNGIGASDIAAIMCLSPWSTPFKVWEEKTGRSEGFEGNAATIRGNELESKARKRYELENLEDMPPAVAVHPMYDICRVSLDGIRSDRKLILEIKCPGEEAHSLAKAGKIPDYYLPQVQYQLAVTGADMCHYFSFGKDETSALVEVKPDMRYQGVLFLEALEFWKKFVLTDTPPPLTTKDVKLVETDEMKDLFIKLIGGDNSYRPKIIKLGAHNKIRCGNYLLSRTKTKNGVESFRLTVKKVQDEKDQ